MARAAVSRRALASPLLVVTAVVYWFSCPKSYFFFLPQSVVVGVIVLIFPLSQKHVVRSTLKGGRTWLSEAVSSWPLEERKKKARPSWLKAAVPKDTKDQKAGKLGLKPLKKRDTQQFYAFVCSSREGRDNQKPYKSFPTISLSRQMCIIFVWL